jgi:hypothetical protein
MPPDAAAAAADSIAAGVGPLAGIPGVPGADGVRRLTDDELLGTMSAAQRLQNRAEWLELSALAEFTRRRYAEEEAAVAKRDPIGQRAGEFANEEVAYQTVRSSHAADERMELAAALATRLPATFARMADGAIGSYCAMITQRATRDLAAENVAIADAILAAEAPFLTPEALRRRASQVTMTFDPDAAAKRKKQGAKHRRVEMWQEESGNAALAGREMDPADALAAGAYYDALARALRKGGVPGTLRELRHLAFTDRNTGRDPLDRIADRHGESGPGHDTPGQDAHPPTPRHPDEGEPGEREDARTGRLRDDGYRDDEPGDRGPWDGDDRDDENGDGRDGNGENGNGGGPVPADPAGTGNPAGGATAPVPANITLLVPVGTLLGWSAAPGEASRLGPLDPETTRDLVQAASRHPQTRWCVTLTGADGTAVGHGCASGRHIWTQSDISGTGGRAGPAPPRTPGPPAKRADQAGAAEGATRIASLLDWLGVTPEPIARGSCDHQHKEDRYTPSRKLGHSSGPARPPVPHPAAGPAPSTTTSTTPSPGRKAPPTNAISLRPAVTTTG